MTFLPLPRPLCAAAMLAGLALGSVWAQDASTARSPEPTPATGAAVTSPAVTPAARPRPAAAGASWQRLSAGQKQALAPLAASWNTLSAGHQRKWLEVSKNYPSLSPAEQAKMHARMAEWAALSPQERAQARLNFGKTTEIARELTPAEKLARWQAYQALSAEERQKLAEGSKTRPLGAAPAIKPVPTDKLAVVPAPSPVRPASRPQDGATASSPPAEPVVSN